MSNGAEYIGQGQYFWYDAEKHQPLMGQKILFSGHVVVWHGGQEIRLDKPTLFLGEIAKDSASTYCYLSSYPHFIKLPDNDWRQAGLFGAVEIKEVTAWCYAPAGPEAK